MSYFAEEANIYCMWSVSLKEDCLSLYVWYVIYVFSFIFRRKTETDIYPNMPKPWMSTTASACPVQGPYAFSDITKLPHTVSDTSVTADIMAKFSFALSQKSQCDDYENLPTTIRESGFVTNDIYETCRPQSHSQAGWVENEIYG